MNEFPENSEDNREFLSFVGYSIFALLMPNTNSGTVVGKVSREV